MTVAFSPVLVVPGMLGKVFRVMRWSSSRALLFSVPESLTILSAHRW